MASGVEEPSVGDQNGTQNVESPTDQTMSDQTEHEQNNTESSDEQKKAEQRKHDAESSDQHKRKKKKEPYAKNYLRISKDNLYMIIALWMEDFVKEAPKSYNKAGAVLVLPNDVIHAADCSRDGVHAVHRLLMKHYDKAEGCKMFMSRKPCPMCAKLLVQAKVQRVLFLPFEPEYYPSEERDSKKQQVDTLFTASAIAQTKFVMQIDESVLKRAQKNTPDADRNNVLNLKDELIKRYIDYTWMGNIEKELPWPAFNEIQKQFQVYFQEVMEWIARVFYIPQSSENDARGVYYDFELCKHSKQPDTVFNPVGGDQSANHTRQAKCLIEIARFLATRTDDPKTGVGAVIASPKMEILALGWNGFPLKAHYGEFARASKDDGNNSKDDDPPDKKDPHANRNTGEKKYPYVIHAEQNALLMRNKKDIEGAILFVTRSPCDECVPLIKMLGVKTVVVDEDVFSRDVTAEKNVLSYNEFTREIEEGTFVCFQTKKADAKNIPVGHATEIQFEMDHQEDHDHKES